MRLEQDVFNDLERLCASPGYVHALAFMCFRDTVVAYREYMTVDDVRHMYSRDRLIRTETSTLIGLLMKAHLDWAQPSGNVAQEYVQRTYALLEELHNVIAQPMFEGITPERISAGNVGVSFSGEALREPIFYGGESAYSFQYRDIAPKKYSRDNDWLIANKGLSMSDASRVARAVGKLQNSKLEDVTRTAFLRWPDNWSFLPGFEFTTDEIAYAAELEISRVDKVLTAFAVDCPTNEAFSCLSDYNLATSAPLLRTPRHSFVVFEQYTFMEALYDSPFYWMCRDDQYRPTALRNRGEFTEKFSRDRLERVFGQGRVHSNVNIETTKGKRAGEIDVLVLFGDRAIVVQAKSKRLTLEARRGNDLLIKDDFRKSVQDSYDQAYLCSELLIDSRVKLIAGDEITIKPPRLKEVYIVCAVADHYPALSFQARQFLQYKATPVIKPPFVMDIFTLDVMAEMLDSPLRFLSYLNRRTEYADRVLAGHETVVLGCHLRNNLWVDKEYDIVQIGDDIGAELDIAMSVRRDGIPGPRTPNGILTRTVGTTLGQVLADIEHSADPRIIDFGFLMLTLSEHAFAAVTKAIDTGIKRALRDHLNHDCTIGLDEAGAGLTVHCNDDAIPVAARRLREHCEVRKYVHKADRWFGLCLSPRSSRLRFGMNVSHKWQARPEMDEKASRYRISTTLIRQGRRTERKQRVGPNEPCPCSSGLKYKKCCGRR